MSEYIDRETIEKNFTNELCKKYLDDYANGFQAALWAVMKIPAADVAPVVKCKECKYYESAKVNNKGFLICPASGMEITDNDFCSYGERKENNNG